MAQLMPLPLTVSCFSKIWYWLTRVVLDKGQLNGCVCVCVCVRACVRVNKCDDDDDDDRFVRGAFGEVRLAFTKADCAKVAVKIIAKKSFTATTTVSAVSF